MSILHVARKWGKLVERNYSSRALRSGRRGCFQGRACQGIVEWTFDTFTVRVSTFLFLWLDRCSLRSTICLKNLLELSDERLSSLSLSQNPKYKSDVIKKRHTAFYQRDRRATWFNVLDKLNDCEFTLIIISPSISLSNAINNLTQHKVDLITKINS